MKERPAHQLQTYSSLQATVLQLFFFCGKSFSPCESKMYVSHIIPTGYKKSPDIKYCNISIIDLK